MPDELASVLLEELPGGVHMATLNRPEVLNALDFSIVAGLHGVLDGLEREEPRALIITGAPPAFSAGGDLRKYLSLYEDKSEFERYLQEFARLCARLEDAPFVTLAMVNGVCAAGGLELLLSCDLALVAESARVGDAHLNFGQLPGAGGSQRLLRAVGLMRARHMLLTGRLFSADEVREFGLVCEVVPDDELRARSIDTARCVAEASPFGIQSMKRLIGIATNTGLEEGLALERKLVHRYATTSADAREGLMAFIENRAPDFRGA